MKFEYTQHFEALAEVKNQLLSGKRLKKDHEKYIIALILNLECGYEPSMVIEHTKLLRTPKGRLSNSYQKMKSLQNQELKKAVYMLDGTDYNRCKTLAKIIKNMKLKIKASKLTPLNDVEKIILNLLKNGMNPPGTPRHLYELLF